MKHIFLFVACMASTVHSAFAQQELIAIDKEISRLLSCGCRCFEYNTREKIDVFKQNILYSAQKLHRHINDTTPCAKIRVHQITRRLLNYVDSSNYDAVFHYNILYARDTTNKENYYNLIVDIIRTTVLEEIKLPLSVTQFIGSAEFYNATTSRLPLLISYLNLSEEIENLKKWGETHSLNEFQRRMLLVSLVRLGDSAATQKYITMTPAKNSDDWGKYIIGLNYARTKPATERLISLLNNTEKTRYSSFSYSDDPQTYYTTVRTLALETLVYVVEDFPLTNIDVPYEYDHFSEASKEDIKKAKRWFKRNPNYKIIRESDYNY